MPRQTGGFGIQAITPTSAGAAQSFNTQGIANQYLAGEANRQAQEAAAAKARQKQEEEFVKGLSSIDKNSVWERDIPIIDKQRGEYFNFVKDNHQKILDGDIGAIMQKKAYENQLLNTAKNSIDQKREYVETAQKVLSDKDLNHKDNLDYLDQIKNTQGASVDYRQLKRNQEEFLPMADFNKNVLTQFGELTKEGRIVSRDPVTNAISTTETKDLPPAKIKEALVANFQLNPKVQEWANDKYLHLDPSVQNQYKNSLDFYIKTINPDRFAKHDVKQGLTEGNASGSDSKFQLTATPEEKFAINFEHNAPKTLGGKQVLDKEGKPAINYGYDQVPVSASNVIKPAAGSKPLKVVVTGKKAIDPSTGYASYDPKGGDYVFNAVGDFDTTPAGSLVKPGYKGKTTKTRLVALSKYTDPVYDNGKLVSARNTETKYFKWDDMDDQFKKQISQVNEGDQPANNKPASRKELANAVKGLFGKK